MNRKQIRETPEGAGRRISDRTGERLLVGDAEGSTLSILTRVPGFTRFPRTARGIVVDGTT